MLQGPFSDFAAVHDFTHDFVQSTIYGRDHTNAIDLAILVNIHKTASDRSDDTPVEEQMNKENGAESCEGHEFQNAMSPHKPRARREEPDVLVVVGDQEFRHHRQILCRASEYFDAALNSGMREAETMRIEFPDEDPREWELFASFMEPFSQAKVTRSNVQKLTPWFHKFGITSMLHVCDQIYADMTFQPFRRRHWHLALSDVENVRNTLHDLLNAYAFSAMYDLSITKEKTSRALRRQITRSPNLFDVECITLLLATLEKDENRNKLWDSLKEYIPSELQLEDPQDLISNRLFPHLLHSSMQHRNSSRSDLYYS